MINYKIDIIKELKSAGYNTTSIKNEKIFPGTSMQKFRENDAYVNMVTIDRICELLDLQPGDILKYEK